MLEIGLPKEDLDTPFLWTDLDVLAQNIADLAAHFQAAGVAWRPHTKGIKIPAIAHRALAAGAIGVTCAKLDEAAVMAAAGINDILIANQIVGWQKITRLVNLCRQADIKVAVDDAANVRQLGDAARAKGVEVGLLVEVNTGMNRAGVSPGQATLDLARQVYETDGVRLRGLMAWEGHTVGIADPQVKQAEIERALGLLADSAALCRRAGLPIEIVSGGGSGTYTISPFLGCLTEVQAGGAIFCDASYRAWGVRTRPALFVRSMVTSHPTPERLIFDAGFKAMPIRGLPPEPVGLPHVATVRVSAEHGIVTLSEANHTVKIGDIFDFIVGYGDATVFLHDRLYGIRQGMVEVVWDILGRGKLG